MAFFATILANDFEPGKVFHSGEKNCGRMIWRKSAILTLTSLLDCDCGEVLCELR